MSAVPFAIYIACTPAIRGLANPSAVLCNRSSIEQVGMAYATLVSTADYLRDPDNRQVGPHAALCRVALRCLTFCL
jgi:hypothetical protein